MKLLATTTSWQAKLIKFKTKDQQRHAITNEKADF